MAVSIRQYREQENRVHEYLHNNLCSLNYFYPPSADFECIFKKNMFLKSNKAAFYEVVYYLLKILNPELTQQKLRTWPPYEIRGETKFRTDLLQYINELNSIYNDADIPHIMASHLISPGGVKFAKFMLKLSQLVIYEHLKNNKNSLLIHCPKPNKNATINRTLSNNIKTVSSNVEIDTRKMMNEFECYHQECEERASALIVNLTDLDEKIGRVKRDARSGEFVEKYPSYPSPDALKEKLKLLQNEWSSHKHIHDLFEDSHHLLSYLNSNIAVLRHDKEEIKLPNSSVNHIFPINQNQLDVTSLFHALDILLEQQSLQLPNPSSLFIEENTSKIKLMNDRLLRLKQYIFEKRDEEVSGVAVAEEASTESVVLHKPTKRTSRAKANRKPVKKNEDEEDEEEDAGAWPFAGARGGVPSYNAFFPITISGGSYPGRRTKSADDDEYVPSGSATAIANSFSTGKGGIATSHATSFGDPYLASMLFQNRFNVKSKKSDKED